MNKHELPGQELAKVTGAIFVHLIAMVAGFAMMIVGVGMGVSLVLLPVGIPVGIIGLLAFIWGLFGWSQNRAGSS